VARPQSRLRDKLGPSNRKSSTTALATVAPELKVRLITASIMEGKSEAEIIRAAIGAALDELGY
jgi:predicted DNA-binding protein